MASVGVAILSAARTTSFKAGLAPADGALEAKYGARLSSIDTDGDGSIDRAELLRFIDAVAAKERQLKHVKVALGAALALLVLFALTTFGTVWGVVVLSRQLTTQNSGAAGSPALVDTAGATLRTAPGVLALRPVGADYEAAAALYANSSTTPAVTRRLLATEGYAAYLGDVAAEDVIEACKLLLDGQRSFTTLDEVTPEDTTDVVDVTVTKTSKAACKTAVATGDVSGLEAALKLDGRDATVVCKAEGKDLCQVFQLVAGEHIPFREVSKPFREVSKDKNSTNSTGRRLAAYPGDETPRMLMVFGEDAVMMCAEEGCGELLERSEGRRQLKVIKISADCQLFLTDATVYEKYKGACDTPPGYNWGLLCHPADAVVSTERAGPTRLDALRVGDRVLAARPDGSTFYDDVYMFGHKDAAPVSTFVQLRTAGGAALRLTADHHVFVTRAGARLEIPASAAQVGDLVQVVSAAGSAGGGAVLEPVASTSLVRARGLFNPYTLSGSIVVDGVAASCHSSSFLDGTFAALGVPLTAGYQALYAPVRVLYRLLGAHGMAKLAPIIDAVVDASNRGAATWVAPLAASSGALGAAAWVVAARRSVV